MRLILFVLLTMFFTSVTSLSAGGFDLMDKDELKAKLGSQDLVIIDVRSGRDWSASEFMIKDAKRGDPEQVDSWADGYDKASTIVLYCA